MRFPTTILGRDNALVTYIRESKNELKKVRWPTRKEVVANTLVVVVASIAVAAFLGALDYLFNLALEYFLRKQ